MITLPPALVILTIDSSSLWIRMWMPSMVCPLTWKKIAGVRYRLPFSSPSPRLQSACLEQPSLVDFGWLVVSPLAWVLSPLAWGLTNNLPRSLPVSTSSCYGEGYSVLAWVPM